MDVQEYRFGPFRLDVHTRMLWSGGAPVALTPKAAELLLVLVQEGERGLTKAQLLDRLWPDTVVAENNLTVTMSALRKALGESATQPRYIQTLSRRGYRFVSHPADMPALSSACDAAAATVAAPPASGASRSQPPPPAGQQRHPERAPFVGRERELTHLQQRYQEALSGNGGVLFISGKPGIGKTALALQFLERCGASASPALVARGRCLESFGSGEAYLPFLEALDALLRGPESGRVQRVLRAFAPTWCGQFPGLAGGQEIEAAQRRELASATRDRMLREWVEAFAALARERPLLVLIEDLHWADPSSIDLLRLLCQRSAGQAWLVLGTLRAAEATLQNPPLAKLLLELGGRECDELELSPLTEPQVHCYLEQRLGANALPRELPAVLLAKTEGHPLFLTRLVALLIERGELVETQRGWALQRPLAELEYAAPGDVQSAIRRQFELLEADALRALSFACVEGQEFSSAVLAALLEEDELTVQERLDPVCRVHHLLDVCGEERWPSGCVTIRYRFAHALYQNQLYADLVSLRRARLHRQIGEVLLLHFGAQASLIAAQLALHFERGRDACRALEFLSLAGSKAQELRAYREASEHYCRALALLDQLEPAERVGWAARLHLSRGWAEYDCGRSEAATADFRASVRHASAAGLAKVHCDALMGESVVAHFAGQLEQSRQLDLELLRVAEASGDAANIALAQLSLAGGAVVAGKLEEARERCERAEPLLEPGSPAGLRAMLLETRAHCAVRESGYAEARALFEAALELWLGISGMVSIGHYQFLSRTYGNLGLMSLALQSYARAEQLAQRNGQEFHLWQLPSSVPWLLRELGMLPEALRREREALAQAQARGARFAELCHWIGLGHDLALLGQSGPSRDALERARAALREPPPAFVTRLDSAQLWLLEAESVSCLQMGDAAGALGSAQQLLTAATRAGTAKYQAVAQLALARSAMLEARWAEAREQLELALELLHARPVPCVSWRVLAELGRVEAELGNGAEARQRDVAAGELVRGIADGLEEPELRTGFMASQAVRPLLARLN